MVQTVIVNGPLRRGQLTPAWALIGLTAPREALREDAARCVANHLCEALTRPDRPPEGQLPLPL
ncbi:DUF6771 family protein [uncultured Sphingomonas sp.]|uniref:DUF6771 family protein n=1 Tax=uncultured Sphingomonas sp. TaxID=158754 RepID=UPI0034585B6C